VKGEMFREEGFVGMKCGYCYQLSIPGERVLLYTKDPEFCVEPHKLGVV